MQTFQQTASACFQIGTSDETVTVEGVPFEWVPAQGERDMQAAYAVAKWIGENNASRGKPVTLIWVSCKEATQAA
jgi:hypothetical protein